jgi:hypothetical protein
MMYMNIDTSITCFKLVCKLRKNVYIQNKKIFDKHIKDAQDRCKRMNKLLVFNSSIVHYYWDSDDSCDDCLDSDAYHGPYIDYYWICPFCQYIDNLLSSSSFRYTSEQIRNYTCPRCSLVINLVISKKMFNDTTEKSISYVQLHYKYENKLIMWYKQQRCLYNSTTNNNKYYELHIII